VNELFQGNQDIYMCTVSVMDPSLKPPVADFFANVTSGNAPLKVLFTYNSADSPDFWHWDFGDGINSKHALNATHTFTEPGEYDVSLTVTNQNGSNTRIMPGYITVYEGK
ncbi:MAG: PKD domain-containing protein, partial [Methanosarcina flavescens]